ncbi:hypothetical protein Tco_1567384, partial [Tanacetum coccineum]
MIWKSMMWSGIDVGLNVGKGNMDKEEHVNSMLKRDKRDVSPFNSVGIGGCRSKKKRKALGETKFEGIEMGMVFNQGKVNGEKVVNKTNIGRRSVTKAKEAAWKICKGGLGKNIKGMSDAYKEYYDVGNESNGIFRFGYDNNGKEGNSKCNVYMEQVKEIGELIGI